MVEIDNISFKLNSTFNGEGEYYIYNSSSCESDLVLSGTTIISNGSSVVNINQPLNLSENISIKFIDIKGCIECQDYELTIPFECEPFTGTAEYVQSSGNTYTVNLVLDSNIGSDLGPFILTTTTGSVIPSTATRQELLDGLEIVIENTVMEITITSDGTCTNSIVLPITGIPDEPCECTFYDLTIGQEDIDDATGNTGSNEQFNNLVLVRYTGCDGNEIIEEYGLADFYENQLCVKQTIGGGPILTYWKDDQESAVNSATSFAINTLIECCDNNEPIV